MFAVRLASVFVFLVLFLHGVAAAAFALFVP